MALTSEQRRNARTIVSEGQRQGASRKQIRAALEAALVETNLRNLSYGDRDSVGIFQERSHYGSVARRRNVRGAARRFFQETRPIRNKYGSAGQLAQARQRSAFPGRYDQQRSRAKAIERSLGVGGGGGGESQRRYIPGEAGRVVTAPVEPGGTGLAALLAEQLSQPREAAVPASMPQSPAFSARSALAMPTGYRPVPSSPVASQPPSSLAEQLMALGDLRGELPPTPRIVGQTSGRYVGGGGGGGSGVSGRVRDGGGYAGTERVVKSATRGMNVSNFKRSPARNRAVGGSATSDHLTTKRNAFAADAPPGSWRAWKRRLGIKGKVTGTYKRHIVKINGRRYSVQILSGVEGHHDHDHLGVKRI